MYLNRNRFTLYMVKSIIILMVTFTLAFWTFICICATLDEHIDEIDMWLFCFMMIVPCIFLIPLAWKMSRCVIDARLLSALFEKDSASAEQMTADEIAAKLYRNKKSIIKSIQTLFNNGILINLTYSIGEELVRFSDNPDRDRTLSPMEFTGVNCPSCGAACKIRHGGKCTCQTCGNTFTEADI